MSIEDYNLEVVSEPGFIVIQVIDRPETHFRLPMREADNLIKDIDAVKEPS